MDKKAIELSVNFLVVIILSLFVFGLGIVFVNKIFSSANKQVYEMDLQTKEELARLLDSGDKVAMPFFQKTVAHGNTATFGIGVLNQLDQGKFGSGYDNDFKVIVNFDKAYDNQNGEITSSSDPGTWLTYDTNKHEIKMNEQATYTIAMTPPRSPLPPSGVYIFNAAVCYKPASTPQSDPYQTATVVCSGDSTYTQGYYHLQKIWLSVK